MPVRIDPLHGGDWTRFIELATAEGWLVPKSERALFQNGWSRWMFALRDSGRIRGFVSAVPHQAGGWIGNLIVDPQCRQMGYGSLLFDFALRQLEASGCREVWLTASEMGRPLYQKKGFSVVDRVTRWVFSGTGGLAVPTVTLNDGLELLCRLDRRAWGDDRGELIHHLAGQGTVVGKGMSIALLQAGMERRVLGPWLTDHVGVDENRQLLQQVSGQVVDGGEIVSDVLSSSGMELLLRESGFVERGGNDLMVCSQQPRAALAGVVALASLGSIG